MRSRNDFWGKLAVTARQMEQMRVGNELHGAMVELFRAHLAVGTRCWMERPMPASWRFDAIVKSPAAAVADFDQCERGQVAWAPTRILALRTGALHGRFTETLGNGRCLRGRGAHEVLMGFDKKAR